MKKYDKIAILIAIPILIFSITLLAQRRPTASEEPTSQQDISDSLASSRSLTGLSGTVAAGVVAAVDSTGALAVASYDDTHLNRKMIGMGTGSAGIMRTSGLIAAPAATKIGVIYWLIAGGSLSATRPTATNVWRVAIGRCTATGQIDLKPGVPIARIP